VFFLFLFTKIFVKGRAVVRAFPGMFLESLISLLPPPSFLFFFFLRDSVWNLGAQRVDSSQQGQLPPFLPPFPEPTSGEEMRPARRLAVIRRERLSDNPFLFLLFPRSGSYREGRTLGRFLFWIYITSRSSPFRPPRAGPSRPFFPPFLTTDAATRTGSVLGERWRLTAIISGV